VYEREDEQNLRVSYFIYVVNFIPPHPSLSPRGEGFFISSPLWGEGFFISSPLWGED
jgi:hypothetical protein